MYTLCWTLPQVVFGTGDSLKAVTLTANGAFVRAAAHQVKVKHCSLTHIDTLHKHVIYHRVVKHMCFCPHSKGWAYNPGCAYKTGNN